MKDTVLITGSSRGIGEAIAKKFAREGHPVIVHGFRHAADAQSLRNALRAEGCSAFAVCGDISREEEALRVADEARQLGGPIGILVNNAGIALPQKLMTDCSPEEWDAVFRVNVRGMFLMSRALVPDMVRRGRGSIVNISSMWGITGGACEVPYSASKAAVIGLSKALAKELAPSHIRVNCVAPGLIDTAMNAHLSAEAKALFTEETPLGTAGTADDVADAVLYLATDRARFVTGQVLSVDGGICI